MSCQYKRKEGSHHILTHLTAKRAVVIPEYDEIDVEIIRNNMRLVKQLPSELQQMDTLYD